ncbi:MAG: hypothetical protein JWP95_849 [Actinotalea sp.]|nr:hypothetical protein [Actinotalea sp.]
MAIELEELLLPDVAAWRRWLEQHHDSSPGVWLVLHKKGGSVTELTYDDALDEALCFGWIDGQGRSRDAETSLQRMTPRGRRSAWSARNVGHIDRLEREGRLRDAGRAQVEAAKADGRWDRAYAGPATAVVAPDLAAAIAAEPAAQVMFDVLTSGNRYAVIYRVEQMRRPESRARKIAEMVAMLARHETLHPQVRRPSPSIPAPAVRHGPDGDDTPS